MGRPKVTTTCLRRQPSETQEDGKLVEMCPDELDDEIPLSILARHTPVASQTLVVRLETLVVRLESD